MKKLLLSLAAITTISAAAAQTPADYIQQVQAYQNSMYADTLGVYAVHGDSLQEIDPIKYQHSTAGTSPFTMGSNLVFPRTTSRHHYTDKAVFRIYLGQPHPADAQRYYMFTSGKTPDDFSVVKFKVKKKNRRLKAFSSGFFALGSQTSIGARQTEDVTVESRKLRNNLYEITVSGPAGEYGIAPIYNGMAGYFGVYDFTIDGKE